MANSNSADPSGARFMKALNQIAGEGEIEYYGYGGSRMASEGLENSCYDISKFSDKMFYTWRKTKVLTPSHSALRWSSWNLVNTHYVRNADSVMEDLEEQEFFKS